MGFAIFIISLICSAILVNMQEATQETFSKTELINKIPDNNSQSVFDLESTNVIYCAAYCSQITDCHSVFYLETQRSCRGYSSLALRTANFMNETNVSQFIMSNLAQDCTDSGFTSLLLSDNSSLCIKLSENTAEWSKSRELCQTEAADLAILDTDEKLSLVYEYIYTISSISRWFIGMSDIQTEGTWKWIDNSLLSVSASRLTISGGTLQNCGIFRAHSDGKLADTECSSLRRCICQK